MKEKKTVFKGIATALITPFKNGGDEVDYDALGRILDQQIAGGVNGVVICGTTGESPTLSDKEHRAVIDYTTQYVAGRIPVIAGTGSNETAYSVSLTRHAVAAGVDAVLVITPYYNKATQNGLVQHFSTVADASEVPLIIYNVPSRTGVNVEPTTYQKLADHENIVGIKEANGNISKIVETVALTEGKLDLYSGNDDQIVPLLAMGGKGCISVLSHVAPEDTVRMCTSFWEGRVEESAALQCRYHALISALFCEVNPIPVKAAMAHLGYCENSLRLPLTRMEKANEERLLRCMRELGINV